jgi:hypothetical protein
LRRLLDHDLIATLKCPRHAEAWQNSPDLLAEPRCLDGSEPVPTN